MPHRSKAALGQLQRGGGGGRKGCERGRGAECVLLVLMPVLMPVLNAGADAGAHAVGCGLRLAGWTCPAARERPQAPPPGQVQQLRGSGPRHPRLARCSSMPMRPCRRTCQAARRRPRPLPPSPHLASSRMPMNPCRWMTSIIQRCMFAQARVPRPPCWSAGQHSTWAGVPCRVLHGMHGDAHATQGFHNRCCSSARLLTGHRCSAAAVASVPGTAAGRPHLLACAPQPPPASRFWCPPRRPGSSGSRAAPRQWRCPGPTAWR